MWQAPAPARGFRVRACRNTLHTDPLNRGLPGTIKRWGHARGLMTHGSKSKRQHGSIGQCATPSRVLPGLKMAGQMGNKRTKVKKLKVRQVGCPECK